MGDWLDNCDIESHTDSGQAGDQTIVEKLTLEERLDEAGRQWRHDMKDKERLDAVLAWSHEIVCKIPGGIRCVDNREDIDAVIEAHRAREESK